MVLDVMRVHNILVHCNIIRSSYMRGTHVPVVYNLFPDAPGEKILEAPHNLIYLLDVISTLSVWVTDQNGELLNFRGEEFTIRFHLRER